MQQAKTLTTVLRTLRRHFLIAGLFSFVINMLMLVSPMYMMQVYDRVLSSRSVSTLILLTVIALFLLLIFGFNEVVRSRILIRLAARVERELGDTVFRAVFRDGLQNGRGSRNQPIRDLDTVRTFMTGPSLFGFFDTMWAPIFLTFVFILHPVLGYIALAGSVMLLFLAWLIESFSRQPLHDANRAANAAAGFAEGSLRNAHTLAAMSMLKGVMARWRKMRDEQVYLQSLASDRVAVVAAISKTIRISLQVLILGVGGYLAITNEITAGAIIAASIIMGRALAPIEALISNWRGFVSAREAFQRVDKLLEDYPDEAPPMPLPAPKGDLAVQGLVAVPPGSRSAVLRGVNFRVKPGEVLGVIGPSAAGKTVLTRMLVGSWVPTAGRVRLDGADVSAWNRDELGSYVGYLPQDIELLDGTVKDNIARFGEVDGEAVVTAAKLAGAHEMILALADGYETAIGERGGLLSGGQRQRVGLARALYGGPMLVVLDEPNSNLDANGETALVAAVLALKKAGKTVILVSHRPNMLRITDKVLIVQNGTAEVVDDPSLVLKKLARPLALAEENKEAREAAEAAKSAEGKEEAKDG